MFSQPSAPPDKPLSGTIRGQFFAGALGSTCCRHWQWCSSLSWCGVTGYLRGGGIVARATIHPLR
jgi:hypothetical protein